MDEKLVAALIGAGAALAVSAIKDIATPILMGLRQRRRAVDQSLERYAVPLADSAASVFFRLREILESGRYQFLMSNSAPTDFHRYKYESTVYRICALFGWLWALKKESSLLIDRGRENRRSLHKSVERIEEAFADGPHVERDRISRLSNLWGLDLDFSSVEFERASIEVNSLFHSIRYTDHNPSGDAIKEMDSASRVAAIRIIANYITSYFKISDVEEIVLAKYEKEAVEILSPRQSWIFRDWQSAIGRLMMREIDLGSSARLFDLIEYDEFQKIYRSGNEWLKKVDDIIRDLDPESRNPNEYRTAQVRKIYRAVADIILVLSSLKLQRTIVTSEVRALVAGSLV